MTMRLAGAALAVVVALTACGGDDDVSSPTTDTTAKATTTTTSTTTTTTPEQPPISEEAYAETAEAWLDAIAAGDLDQAWRLTARASQAAVGGRDRFQEMEIELAEGWAAWGRADEVVYRVARIEDGDDPLAIVLLEGTVAQEGPPAEAFAALPVRWSGSSGLVDPFVDLGEVDLQPPAGSELGRDDAFRALVPMGSEVRFILDPGPGGADAEPATSSEATGDDRQQDVYDPEGPLEPGRHHLAVVVQREGDVMVRTADYVVAG